MLDCLEGRDRPLELLALLRVRDRELERRGGGARGFRGGCDRTDGERAPDRVGRLGADDGGVRADADVVEDDAGGAVGGIDAVLGYDLDSRAIAPAEEEGGLA